MKFKISKKFALYGILFALTAAFAGGVDADGYENLLHPSIIPTAYQDAQYSVNKSQKAASDAKKSASESDSSSDAKKSAADATKSAEESKANLADNVRVVMNAGNFGSTGLFFGPTSGNSKVDAYGALTSTPGLDRTGIENFAANTGQADKVHAYHAFGLAMTHLKDSARKTSGESIGIESAAGGIIALAKSFSMFGLKLLKAFNPFPVIASFYDSSFLNNANYTTDGSSEKNELINLINSNDMLSGAIHLFGDPVTVGPVTTSLAYMITATIVFAMFGYGAFTKLWNGQRMSITFRKAFVKILIASVAIPLVSVYGSRGLSWTIDTIDQENETKEQTILRNNLNIYNWYKNASFGLPPGTTLTVRNGYFVFTPETVEAINKWSATNRSSASSSLIVDDYTNPFDNTGVIKTRKPSKPASKTDLSDSAVANGIVSAARTNKNTTKVSFAPSYSTGFVSSAAAGTGGTPWDVSDIVSYAEALGSNKKYDGKDKSVAENQYITNAGLVATQGGNDLSYTFTQSGNQYGISPLAAFNLMSTDFNESGFVVRTNTSDITTPTIAPYVITDASQQVKAPGIIKIVVMFTIMMSGIKALMTIISSSFGALFRGGAGAALGSAAGAGNLVGGAIALTLGVLGLSVIMTIAVGLMDMFYTFIAKVLFSWDVLSAIQDVSKEVGESLFGWIAKIPIIGDLLASIITSLTAAVMGIVAMMMMPQLVKTPTIAYGEFVAGIPSAMSERFATWERVFTGDYHSGSGGSIFSGGSRVGGGRGASGGGSELEKMKAREAEKRKDRANAMKTGAGMLASASLATLGSYLAFGPQNSNKDGDINDIEKNESLTSDDELVDGSKNIDALTENEGDFIGPKEAELDEDGNPILRPLSDDDSVIDNDNVSLSLDNGGQPQEVDSPVVNDYNPEAVQLDNPNDLIRPLSDGLENTPPIATPITPGSVQEAQTNFEGDAVTNPISNSNTQNNSDGGVNPTSSISNPQTHNSSNEVTNPGSTSSISNENIHSNGGSVINSSGVTNKGGDVNSNHSGVVNTGVTNTTNGVTSDPSAMHQHVGDGRRDAAGGEITTTPHATSSISDSQTTNEYGQRDRFGSAHGDVVTNNGILTNVEGLSAMSANNSVVANNAESVVASADDKSDKRMSTVANDNKSEISQSSVSKVSNQSNKSQPSNNPSRNNPPRQREQNARNRNTSQKPTKSIGKFRQVVGKTMMGMGGVDHKQPLEKGSMKGMAIAGAAHAIGGAVGAHKLTNNHAQRKIDQRNEHIVRNGGQIKSNLSATGESRKDAQERLEKRVKETPRPIRANSEQPSRQESVRQQRQNKNEPRRSPKQDPRED